MSEVDRPGDCDFLSGGGQMDTRMRAFDWTTTPLGPPERWPQNLKDAIASHVSAAGVNAPAREDERRRAEAPRAEEVLRESDARLRAVIEEAPLAIALTDDPAKSCCATRGSTSSGAGRRTSRRPPPTATCTRATISMAVGSHRRSGLALVPSSRVRPSRTRSTRSSRPAVAGSHAGSVRPPFAIRSGEIVGAVVVFRNVTDERRTARGAAARKRRTRRSRSPQGRIHRRALARAAQPARADPLRAAAAGRGAVRRTRQARHSGHRAAGRPRREAGR